MPEESYDVVVIGGRPGGYVAAIRAAQRGMIVVAWAAGLALHGAGCGPAGSEGRSDSARAAAAKTDTARPAAAAATAGSQPAPAGPTSTTPAVRVGAARGGTIGAYLVDARGRALYLLEEDGAGPSTCVEMCAVVWPPLLAGQGAPVPGDSAVQPRLLGSAPRPGGGAQVTYGGRPLYYYIGDAKPGDVNGQHVEDSWGEWYLVRPTGGSLESERGRGERSGGRRRRGDDR